MGAGHFAQHLVDGDFGDLTFDFEQADFPGLKGVVEQFMRWRADEDAAAVGERVRIGQRFVVAFQA